MRNSLVAMILVLSPKIWAQDPPRFSPPRPPPMDQDFEDPAEEDFEPADIPNRAGAVPPPPMNQGSALAPSSPPPPPPQDFRPPPTASPSDAKVKFKIVEGAFYEKGKKRGRSPQSVKSR